MIFTAHSVPCRTIQVQPPAPGQPASEPDPYSVDAKRTAENVAALLAPVGLTAADWFFAFQSQGMSGAAWIGPTVEDTLTALRRQGHTGVVIQPIGFLCDHVEILYDIDIGFRDFGAKIGLEVLRPLSLNDSPLLTAALEDLAQQGFARLCKNTCLTGRCCMSSDGFRPRRIAIIGGGISGLAAAYQLAGLDIPFTLFEASARLGGIIETVHTEGFVIECGPDSWVTEKPWARELAVELGLEDQIISSNDSGRRTYVQQGRGDLTHLVAIPDGMRMMVPSKWGPLLESPLFSEQARLAYLSEPERAAELKAQAPAHDESVAEFVRRHFGEEVAATIAGPLLSAVFGGDIAQLSVRAVMPTFVRMEAEEGSLIQAMQGAMQRAAQRGAQQTPPAIFTSLTGGLQTLVDRMAAKLPAASLRLQEPVLRLNSEQGSWRLITPSGDESFDTVVVTTPPHITRALLGSLNEQGARIASLLPEQATSAIVVALGFAADQAEHTHIPSGFGYIVPPVSPSEDQAAHALLACTFVHQKFPYRAPEGGILLRAFFGGRSGEVLMGETDEQLIARARWQLSRVLGPLPEATATVLRRWPQSLPQYAVGHLDRMAELQSLLRTVPGLYLLGSAYYGVGLPDLIREGRATARALAAQTNPVLAQ